MSILHVYSCASLVEPPGAAVRRRTVIELGFRHGMNYIVPVWTLLSPLRTKEVGVLLPPSEPCRCGGLGQVLTLSVVDVGRP